MNHQMDNKMLFQKNYISWLYHVKPMDRSRVKVKGLFRKNICEIFGVYHFLNITNQNFFSVLHYAHLTIINSENEYALV